GLCPSRNQPGGRQAPTHISLNLLPQSPGLQPLPHDRAEGQLHPTQMGSAEAQASCPITPPNRWHRLPPHPTLSQDLLLPDNQPTPPPRPHSTHCSWDQVLLLPEKRVQITAYGPLDPPGPTSPI